MPCIILKPGLHGNGVDVCWTRSHQFQISLDAACIILETSKTLTDLRTDILCDMTAPEARLKHSLCDTTPGMHIPCVTGESSSEPLPSFSSGGKEDLRWLVTPMRTEAWEDWFATQLKFSSKAKLDNGLFVGLRLDGRVSLLYRNECGSVRAESLSCAVDASG